MVVGVEGNVHVGKTTYIKNNFKNYNIIDEIKFNKNLNDYDRQLYYIDSENKRLNYLSKNTVLDRTIISTAIYSFNSDRLTIVEQNALRNKIKVMIDEHQFIIPEFVHYIIYPYKLICANHKKLYEEKQTQSELIDYNYYLKYNLFFSIYQEKMIDIIDTNGYRQILKYSDEIYNDVTSYSSITSVVALDGFEASNDNYCLNDIIENINTLGNNVLKNSFIYIISRIFNNLNKYQKLKLIDSIMLKVALNKYISKIIYFRGEKNEYSLKFYTTLNKNLKDISNIYFVDNKLTEKDIFGIKDKPLLLIDLFYELKECVKRGDL